MLLLAKYQWKIRILAPQASYVNPGSFFLIYKKPNWFNVVDVLQQIGDAVK